MDHTVFTLQLHHSCLYLVKHSPDGATTDSNNSLITAYFIYQLREDERLNWPSWLTYSGPFTHINGNPSAAGPVQTSESSPVRNLRSTTELHHQLVAYKILELGTHEEQYTQYLYMYTNLDYIICTNYN